MIQFMVITFSLLWGYVQLHIVTYCIVFSTGLSQREHFFVAQLP